MQIKKCSFLVFIVPLLIFCLPQFVGAKETFIWKEVKSSDELDFELKNYVSFLDIVSNGSIYVAVGQPGLILTSTDSENWEVTKFSYSNDKIKDVIWDGHRFIAVGYGTVYISYDGLVWEEDESNKDSYWFHTIYWTGKEYLATAQWMIKEGEDRRSNGDIILTSKDAIHWENLGYAKGKSITGNFRPIFAFAGNKNYYVGVGNAGYTVIANNAYSWKTTFTEENLDVKYYYKMPEKESKIYFTRTSANFYDVIWDGTKFIAIGEAGEGDENNGVIYTSKDGIKWTLQLSIENAKLDSMTTDGEKIYVLGQDYKMINYVGNFSPSFLLETKDGLNWSKTVITDKYLESLYWDGKQLLAVGPKSILRGYTTEVRYNDDLMNLTINPILIEGRTMVPLRDIFEIFNAKVDWNSGEDSITASKDNNIIKLYVDKKEGLLNGKSITLDVSPVNIRGKVMVPLRFVSESLGVKVDWNDQTNTILLSN